MWFMIMISFICMMMHGMEQKSTKELKFLVFNREFLGQINSMKQNNEFLTGENFLLKPEENSLEEFQADLDRLKKKYNNQKKEERLAMTPLQLQRLKDCAIAELEVKKKENALQYMTIEQFRQLYETQDTDSLYKYVSIRCCFPSKARDNCTIRYFVQDHLGANSVYATSWKQNQIPKKVLKEIQKQRRTAQNKNKGGAVLYEQDNEKKTKYIYYVTEKKSLEIFTDQVGCWQAFDMVPLISPITFIASLQHIKNTMVQNYQSEAKAEKSAKEKAEQLIGITKTTREQTILSDLLEIHGPDLFYEKMMYHHVLQDHIPAIEGQAQKDSFLVIDDTYEESYGIKHKDAYYLFGVHLEPEDSDAELVVSMGGYWRGFTDELARITKG